MTEIEWRRETNCQNLYYKCVNFASERKLRLFGCACCRRFASPLIGNAASRLIDLAEEFSDGVVSPNELTRRRNAAVAALNRASIRRRTRCEASWTMIALALSAQPVSTATASGYFLVVKVLSLECRSKRNRRRAKLDAANQYLCAALRDMFGNPFRARAIDPAWLAWNNRTIPKLAQTIYDDRRYDIMPILGDALEDAGCADERIIEHCRGPGPHVRGCWVVDLMLGKS